jgi:hypothetical protein
MSLSVKKPKIETFINVKKYVIAYADTTAQLVNVSVRRFARKYVRKDTKALMNNIQTSKVSDQRYMTYTDLPYSLAQEYGRPDLMMYGFTPYMGPAAAEAGSQQNIYTCAMQAEEAARFKAQAGKR